MQKQNKRLNSRRKNACSQGRNVILPSLPTISTPRHSQLLCILRFHHSSLSYRRALTLATLLLLLFWCCPSKRCSGTTRAVQHREAGACHGGSTGTSASNREHRTKLYCLQGDIMSQMAKEKALAFFFFFFFILFLSFFFEWYFRKPS